VFRLADRAVGVYHDVEPAVRFLNRLGQQAREPGATAHLHIDATTGDERTDRTLRELFDDVSEG
jgi:hypothetical protein